MHQRRSRVGRPSKGDRHSFLLALLPADQTDAILAAAAARGLPYSEYLAVVVAREHGFATPWPPAAARLLGTTARTHEDHPRLSTRVPRAAAEVAIAAAESREMPHRRYIAAVVARAHGFPAVLPDPVPDQAPQEALISA